MTQLVTGNNMEKLIYKTKLSNMSGNKVHKGEIFAQGMGE